jgi:hypothetical protein
LLSRGQRQTALLYLPFYFYGMSSVLQLLPAALGMWILAAENKERAMAETMVEGPKIKNPSCCNRSSGG